MNGNSSEVRLISGKWKSLGTGQVLRLLPTAKQRTVGPFVFVDHMGGAATTSSPGSMLVDVPPHPHIGIATVTYLFEGAIFHRDSIGSAALIEPGAVNWMTSGRGIVHSERTPENLRKRPPPLFGVQSWVALPKGDEDVEPSFQHVPAAALPVLERAGAKVRLIAGTGFGKVSPVEVASPLLCAAVESTGASRLEIPCEHAERAVIVLSGKATVGGVAVEAGAMAVIETGFVPELAFSGAGRAFVIGGPGLPERRYLDWNFCSTRPERIAEAKAQYRRGELGVLPDDGPNLPLPEDVR